MKYITDIKQLDLTQKYNYADYLTWWFDERVELIKGYILKMSPAPLRQHQKISMKISRLIGNFLDGKTCEVYTAPFDVRFHKKEIKNHKSIFDVVQPDICVVCDPSKLDDLGCIGAPDLIIEILSEGNKNRDLKNKMMLYEENLVKEYWVVFPKEQIVQVFHLENEKYGFPEVYEQDSIILSKVLAGFEIQNDRLFS
ncbi:MAG: Uma2 family endonuclease [Bacteroidetes bacterium]|nr:MAG: Uma2 family endonuclease [Bacteroidota bacterium]